MKKFWEKIKNLRIWAMIRTACRKIGSFFACVGRGIASAAKQFGAWFLRHWRVIAISSAAAILSIGIFLALFLTLPVKSVEIEGEVVLLEGEAYTGGLNVKATTKAGLVHRESVLPSMMSGLDPTAPGEQSVTVRYDGWRVKATVKVIALSDITLCVREGSMPETFEPNDPFPKHGIFDIYYNGERIRSAPITRAAVPGFTTKLSSEYDVQLVYKGIMIPYHYTVLEVIESVTPEGVFYAPQGVALSKANAVGNMRLLVKYKDGTTETVMVYDDLVQLPEAVMEDRGEDYESEVTLSYKGIEFTCPVTAYHGDLLAPKSVTLHLGKSVYAVGETFDYSSAYLEVVYERFGETPVLLRATQETVLLAELKNDAEEGTGSAVLISDGTAPILFDEVKGYIILARYNEMESTPISVRVVSEEDAGRVTALSTTWVGTPSGPPLLGQDLDFTDAALTVEYGFGYRTLTVPLTEEMVTGYDKNTAGDQTLTITYQDEEAVPSVKEIRIRIGDPDSDEVTGIFMLVAWNEPTYYTSDELVVPENAYLEVEVGYGGHESRMVYLKDNADVTITGFTPHTIEEQTLTISYKGFSIKQPLTVKDDRTEYITGFWAPYAISVNVGAKALDLSGECTVSYSTGRQEHPTLAEVLEAGGTMTGTYDLNTVNDYRVRFYYPGFDSTDHATRIYVNGVAPVTVTGIRLDATKAKTTYKVGESIDTANMKLYLMLSDDTELDKTSDLTFANFPDFSTASVGDFTAEIIYFYDKNNSHVTTFEYHVVNA